MRFQPHKGSPRVRIRAKHHGGRTLDLTRDAALRQATLELLAETGYDRLTIAAVAARAHAGKATVYRRWATKVDMVVDAVTHKPTPVFCPDTGSLRGDLEAVSRSIGAQEDQLFDVRLLTGLVTAVLHHPELRAAIQQAADPAAEVLRVAFQRAVERSEISPGLNVELIASLFPALVFYRLILAGEAPTARFANLVLNELILPLANAAATPLESAGAVERLPKVPALPPGVAKA
jgi:AcrR family transcriptional regulator